MALPFRGSAVEEVHFANLEENENTELEVKATLAKVELEDLYAEDQFCSIYYGWLIVVMVFIFHVLHVGALYSSGVFYNELVDTFGASNTEVSMALSLPFSVFTGTAAFVGCLTDRIGHRKTAALGALTSGLAFLLASYAETIAGVTITFGALQGVAICLCWLPATTILQLYFSRRKSLAVGLAVSGSGIGNAAVVPMWQAMINFFGWRDTLRVSAAIWVVTGLALAVMIRLPRGAKKEESRARTKLDFCCHKEMLILFLSFFLFSLGYFVPFVHILSYATEFANETEEGASMLLTSIGLASFLGRIASGQAADKIGVLEVYVFSMIVVGLSTCIVPFITSPGYLLFFAIPYGFFSGARVALLSILVAEFVGLEGLATKVGIVLLVISPANFLGPTFAGWLYDTSGAYDVAFWITSALMLSSGIPLLYLLRIRRKETAVKPEQDVDNEK